MSSRPHPNPHDHDHGEALPQRRRTRAPLYLVQGQTDEPAAPGTGAAGQAPGSVAADAQTTWLPQVAASGVTSAGGSLPQPRAQDGYRDEATMHQPRQLPLAAVARDGAGSAAMPGLSWPGQPEPGQFAGWPDQPPAGQPGPMDVRIPEPLPRLGMPWPRRPYELLPPSPELAGEVRRRPDTEIDPAERAGVTQLRWAVVHRLTEITVNHAEAAWQLRYSKPVAPTLVVLLFAVPYTDQGLLRFALRADARTWHQSDRVADAAAVLQEMAGIVHRGWRDVSFDVRAALTNQPDEQWTGEDWRRRPEFVGVALSTLDTSEYGTWNRAQGRARFGDDVPSEVLAQFTDGGRLRIMRHAARQYHRIERQASMSLHPDRQPPALPWESTPALNRIWSTDPTAYTWHFLGELTRTVYWGWQAWR
ncbi:hypothetical protein GCM10010170_025850 [Dactylosporangium salmoneum]|uniref:Uncharacterized protein n=2 Tax=Dactylosporangium salmoneum TaxID=53361 RepID=A0ABP5SZ05_9ACTN